MSKHGMSTFGSVVAGILVVVGLTVVGFFVFVAIALSNMNFGSNK